MMCPNTKHKMKTRLTSMTYLGYTAMDRRFSNAMLPWLLREIRRTGVKDKLSVVIEDGYLKAYNENFEPAIVHRLVDIIRASQVPGRPEELFYILFSERESLLNCYLFRASTVLEVTDLFSQMRETSPGGASPRGSSASLANGAVTKNLGFQSTASSEHLPWNTAPSISLPKNCHLNLTTETQSPLVRTTSNASALTSLCADLSPSDSHFFEVLYIGKVRISQRKVPESLIDDALQKFAQHEADKARTNQMRRNSLLSSTGTSIYSNGSLDNLTEEKVKIEPHAPTVKKNVTFSNTSTTPLEPDKDFAWKSAENIKDTEKPKTTKTDITVLEKPISPIATSQVDQEFDMFTKERVEKNGQQIRRPTTVPLEPKVLILNVPSNNLGTVSELEEKPEDIQSIISDTASSITHFCQTNLLKDKSQVVEIKETDFNDNNPFLKDLKEKGQIENDDKRKDSLADPLVNLSLPTKLPSNIDTPKHESYIKLNQEEPKGVLDTLEKPIRQDSPAPINFDEITRKPKLLKRSKTGLDKTDKGETNMPENKPFLRDRSASIGILNLKTPISQIIGEQNRTMLFQVGRTELRLISPDRKQILLHRAFKDVASCVLGRASREHFGFVCRESANDAYACYVFKCESDEVALEVVNAIKQAFVAHAELLKKSRERSPNMTCDHCPMLWYHRLCHDIEGMNEKKTHAFILRRIENLPDDEQEQVITKYQGGTSQMYETCEHNAFLMMLLRAHCESKQIRHIHDTAENRSEFLNQYLGGGTIFMKAKRSLSSGFDNLLKRRASRDDGTVLVPQLRKDPSPISIPPIADSASETSGPGVLSPSDVCRSKSLSPAPIVTGDPPPSPTTLTANPLPSTTEEDEEEPDKPEQNNSTSPMMDIFLKVSDSRSSARTGDLSAESEATWRQAIYQKVMQPSDVQGEGELSPKNLLNLQSEPPKGKRTREQLRGLWKMAIDQTILLVRMEKENAKLKESEESSAVRRIKLEYTELSSCEAGVTLMWDSLLAARKSSNQISKVDHHMLTQAVLQGVPRMCRGGVWYFLAEQVCLRTPPPDAKKFPFYNTPYRTLLGGLTKHQHAILIDLGRTFPQHSYFSSALGPGQLALYNILKAYSLLDPEVGYCQGLSFVAGVLLLHMEEGEAFILLRHLMFRRGLRKQYLPDMSALQVQLYQLSRLLRDHEPELHEKLESLDISPALYAAPWMLTLFTSQFPLGFVVRVFDLIFLESMDIVFLVSLALLSAHKDGLMLCESCEEGAEYLKHKLPDMDKSIFDKVMKKVLSLDISRQLTEYAVEYTVLREEMPRVTTLGEANRKLVADNNRMSDELDSAMDAIINYQNTQTKMENQVKMMEHHLTLLSRYISTHQRQELPPEVKKVVQNYIKKQSFGSKIFSSKTINEDENEDLKKNFKTGVSSPNLFAKISKEDLLNAANKEKSKTSPENDRRHFMMKKSQSVHSGLIASNLKQFPLKVLDEKAENVERRGSIISETNNDVGKKHTGFFANTHEQIRQERLFEQQLKHDFDENLKKLDQKLTPKSYIDDVSMFQSRKSMSLNFTNAPTDLKVNIKLNDSGFVTPLSPEDKKEDTMSIVSHPLSDIDVDIKFDGQLTKLKQIRPISRNMGRNGSIESVDYKQA